MIVGWHLYFSGNVQGVGFRYTASRAARQAGLSGWIRNLQDGRVEMRVEGKSAELAGLIHDIREATHGRVDDVNCSVHEASGEFSGFEILKTP